MDRLQDKLGQGLRHGLYTAASLLAFEGERAGLERFAGELDGAPIDAGHFFDLASLTKPLALVTSLIRLQEKKVLTPRLPLGEVLPRRELHPDLARQPLANFLAHCSGLPDWRPLYADFTFADGGADRQPDPSWRDEMVRRVCALPPSFAPQSRAVYSDLGFILLTAAAETAAGCRLDQFYGREIGPLFPGSKASFRPLPAAGREASQVVPTGLCTWRGKWLRGEVNDQNAWAMGGVSGHAGLFARARDLLPMLAGVRRSLLGQGPFPERLLEPYLKKYQHPPDSTWCLGFDTPSQAGSSSGRYFTKESTVGHLGYTGTSFWLDLESGRGVILLTNRPQAGEQNKAAFRKFRPELHDLVFEVLGWGGTNAAGN